MRRYSITYFLGQSISGLLRNGVMSVASITVLMSCLIVVGSFGLLVLNIDYNMENLGDLNTISAFVQTDTEYAEGDEVILAGPLKAKNGAEFLGWSLDPNAETPTYAPGQRYTINPADAKSGKITMYAVWSIKPYTVDYGIAYDMSGVSIEGDPPVDSGRYNHGDEVVLADAPTPKLASNTFLGWSTVPGNASELEIMQPGSTYKLHSGNAVCATVTLYAVWSNMPVISTYEVVYNANRTEIEGSPPTQDRVILMHIAEQVSKLDNIKRVDLISKEMALKEEKERYAEYPEVIEAVLSGKNPYPDNFLISYYDNDNVATLIYQLNQIEGIYKVRDRSDLAARIDSLKSGIIIIFSWFMILLFVVSVFINMNTVKLAVFTRRQEISIMRYVGATNWFITLPFVLEGVFIGLLSAGLAYLIEWYIYIYLQRMVLSDTIQMIHIVSFSSVSRWLLLSFIGIGVLTGVTGSLISMRKYLKA